MSIVRHNQLYGIKQTRQVKSFGSTVRSFRSKAHTEDHDEMYNNCSVMRLWVCFFTIYVLARLIKGGASMNLLKNESI